MKKYFKRSLSHAITAVCSSTSVSICTFGKNNIKLSIFVIQTVDERNNQTDSVNFEINSYFIYLQYIAPLQLQFII